MFSFDTVTRLVVGRAAAERSEYKRLERKYKDAEANLKLVREVTRASTTASSAHSRNGNSIRSGPVSASSPSSTPGGAGAVSDEPNLQRTQSTPTVATAPSAALDSLKRTYSEPRIAIPLPQMTGFGKYRRAVDASASWQLNHLEQRLKLDGDIIAGFLGDDPPVGLDPQIWQQYRATRVKVKVKVKRRLKPMTGIRSTTNTGLTNYYGSSGSMSSTPPSTPVTDASSEYTDPVSGTRIVRGFTIADSTTISNTSSAASSYNKSKKACSANTVGDDKQGLVSAFRVVEMPKSDIGINGAARECAISSDDEDDDEDDEEDEDEEEAEAEANDWDDME
ncbi:hypothetical protein PV04_06789 [Phialophora macrospora]|uniref:Uncharacterized protein n=1 Tax=Phialophora macrospora TaxID=1851006 RepID=A0A0D2FLF8_9EURO|nr:hypothetical protein PV04_06789 [Phialophora macrospora]